MTGGVQDANIPLQHQQPGTDLPGHPEGPVEPSTNNLKGAHCCSCYWATVSEVAALMLVPQRLLRL